MKSAEAVHDRRSAQSAFRPDIEGLRAVAVLGVVLFHAAVPGITGGYVGVDVFFVISGFLITGLLWREASSTGTVRLRSFYGARARRLLPASAFVGVVTMVASVLLLPPLRIPTVLYDGIASALYVGNYWFIIDNVNYFADLLTPSPFLHYWSLGVEEQFYLVWAPLILVTTWLVRRRRRRRPTAAPLSRRPYLIVLGVVAAVSFALSLVVTYVVPPAAFFSLPTRAWQLAVGGLLALTAAECRRLSARAAATVGWGGLMLIVAGCVWFVPATPFPGTAALVPTVGAAMVIGAGCATPDLGCGKLLAAAPMRAIGRISYSWYLWHWPVLVLGPALLGHPLGLAARIIAALLSAGLAWLTLRYLENPLRFSPRIRDSAGRSLGLGAAATAIAVCAGLVLQAASPTPAGHGPAVAAPAITPMRVSAGSDLAAFDGAVHDASAQVQAAVAAAVEQTAVPANLAPPLSGLAAELKEYTADGCLLGPYENRQPECVSGDPGATTTVALIGDSHATMWRSAFQELATDRRWRLETMAKGACPFVAISRRSPLIERLQHCERWREGVLERLRTMRPRLVVLSTWRHYGVDETLSGFTAYDQQWFAGLNRMVRELTETGAQVLVLGPIPAPHTSVPVCLSGHLDDVRVCLPSRKDAVNAAGIAAESLAVRTAGGHYEDLTDLFCTAEKCAVIVGNIQVYLDALGHLTFEYSRFLTPVLGAFADRVMAHGSGT